ncbi:MAG: deoxyribose-phosphate aldolase [Legionella sp.]|nr:MAG: deoxyribose-phosphate aldolase [Legionella sp.]
MPTVLDIQFDAILQQLDAHILSSNKVLPFIDLTLLNESATTIELDTLVQKAQRDQVAAICVFPQHLAMIPSLQPIQRATVVNFPGGDQAQDHVLQAIEGAILQFDADEIDYVFAYPHYLAGHTAPALAWCREAYQLCQQHGRMFKVIIETGALGSLDTIYQVSREIIEAGCDMLKTSTGKIGVGASLPAVFAMLTAIKDSQRACGIKVSGGVKTLHQASSYIHLAETILNQSADASWFRIGASSMS